MRNVIENERGPGTCIFNSVQDFTGNETLIHIVKMKNLNKKLFGNVLVILLTIISGMTFSSCSSDEENSIENEIFLYLQGEWVTTHMSEEEHFMGAVEI